MLILFCRLKSKRVIPVEKGILLHWKPNNLQYWIQQCLPKLNFLLENDWFGEYESVVFLPNNNVVREYVELLMIEEERIIWLRRDQIFNVNELTIIDYRPMNKKIGMGFSHPPTPLLRELRESLTGESWEKEKLDVISIVRDNTHSTLSPSELINEVESVIEHLQSTSQIHNSYTVIELDPNASMYHQMFAFKRSR